MHSSAAAAVVSSVTASSVVSSEPPQAPAIKDNAAKPATANLMRDFLMCFSPEDLGPLVCYLTRSLPGFSLLRSDGCAFLAGGVFQHYGDDVEP